jgi:hypothetical protein
VLITVFAIAATLAAVSVVTPTGASAQSSAPAPTLTLLAQDPWTPLGGAFTMQLQTSGNVDGLSLVLTSHERITSRTAFDDTIRGGGLGTTLTLPQAPLDAFPPDGPYGLRNVSFSLDALGINKNGGVYPVEVQLRTADNQTVTGFVTHVIVVDPASVPVERLRLAWVWPLVAAPRSRPS